MKTINLVNKAGVFTLILLFIFQSCSSNNDAGDDSSVNAAPSNLSVQVEPVGKTAENPNGDGSGKVQLTISATNAQLYKVLINNELKEITTGSLTYEFTASGTKSYPIIVSAYNGSKFVSSSTSVNVFVARKVIWSDEFNVDGSPDSSKWGYNTGTGDGWGNNELEYYTNRSENVKIENGTLKITAIKENYLGSQYTSTRMLTKGKFSFKYGRAEVRAKLPVGGGTWPAFWLLGDNIDTVGWPACGEIDILESVGNNPNVIHSSLHSPGRSGNTPDTKTTTAANSTTEFHIYAAEWSAENIKFYVDDNLFYTYKNSSTTPFNQKFFIILNLAMGGNFGGAVDPNFTSATFEVDYVRVYN
ncbi:MULTISPECIES: glycoside hydrolase family 16 protein [unclassified Flavobacterium]|jgi:beta-glucanase (GH16 family)|uniref:glycoside hydrolase family 16 protein n=1 Tax=unclassified Flavobacterium TaxID=196869 RepID=UPI001066EC09|nr:MULTISPECIES: glycoside hydrolase family 16 protein [unclassified Flavobacterium]MDQ1164112.1 beta-glucanase (GH16 family) [Flavobacterium sp. SORGH_AS_0622]TDX14031.1 beta-glucanase (GH16 family) [Flavobacterium sp. S87F.05.LMB.W.Kidney.N]